MDKREQDERQCLRQWGRQSLRLLFAIEAGACRAACLLNPFRFLVFQRAAHFWIELFEALLEHEKIAPVVLGCRSNEPVLLWHFGQFMLWDARIQRQGTRRYMAEKFILTHTHTHTHEMSYEMFRGHCHSRCRISWRRSRTADLRILRSKDSLEQKVVLTFRRVLANICRPVMETVPVLSFGKWKEKVDKIWRKLVDYWLF